MCICMPSLLVMAGAAGNSNEMRLAATRGGCTRGRCSSGDNRTATQCVLAVCLLCVCVCRGVCVCLCSQLSRVCPVAHAYVCTVQQHACMRVSVADTTQRPPPGATLLPPTPSSASHSVAGSAALCSQSGACSGSWQAAVLIVCRACQWHIPDVHQRL